MLTQHRLQRQGHPPLSSYFVFCALSLQFQPPEAARVPIKGTPPRQTNSCSYLWQWHYRSDMTLVMLNKFIQLPFVH